MFKQGSSSVCNHQDTTKYFWIICTGLSFIALGTILLQIPRGIGAHDEAWYLMVFRDHVSENGSAWNQLLYFLPDSIVILRTLSLFVRISSTIFVALSFRNLSDFHDSVWKWVAGAAILSLVVVPGPVYCAAYYNLNAFCFSVSLFLISASLRYRSARNVLTVFSGVFLSLLFFTLPTNFPLCFLLYLVFFLLRTKSVKDTFKKTFFLCLGVLLGAAYFFAVCESFSSWWSMVLHMIHISGKSTNIHGGKVLALWCRDAGSFVGFNLVATAYLITNLIRKSRKGEKWSVADRFTSVAVVIGLLVSNYQTTSALIQGFSPEFPVIFPWLLMIVSLLLVSFFTSNQCSFVLLLLTVLGPVFLSFGTAVSLQNRCPPYVGVFLVATILTVIKTGELKKIPLGRYCSVLTAILVLNFAFSFRTHFQTWIVLEHNFFATRTKDETTGLLLTSLVRTNLQTLRSLGLENKVVQPIGTRSLWHYIYELKAHPLSREFECREDIIDYSELIQKTHEDTFYILTYENHGNLPSSASAMKHLFDFQKLATMEDFKHTLTVFKATRKTIATGK